MHGVLFDARWLRQGMTGVGKFALHVLEALPAGDGRHGLILPEGSPFAARFPGFRLHFTRVDLTSHPLTDIYEQLRIPWLCRSHGYRSFVSFEGRVPLLHPGIKTFSVIYDLSFLKVRGSHTFKYSAFLYLSLRASALSATRIVTISQSVRGELERMAGIPGDRVMVVYPADSRLGGLEPEPIPGLDKPFFLAVGMTNPRKNLEHLLTAFARFNAGRGGYRLALTGDGGLIGRAMRESETGSVVNLGFVGERQLAWLYREAEALVFPSFDEGFGIPLVDATVFGCPVICSDIPVFREVMGEEARYFDPASPDSIAAALGATGPRTPVPEKPPFTRFTWEQAGRSLLAGIRAAGG